MPLYLAVVAGSWVTTRLPLRVAYAIGSAVGVCAYVFSRRARRAIQGNLAVVLGLPPPSLPVRRTALAAFRNNSKNWIDSLRLGATSTAEIERRVVVDGWERVEEALANNRGVIMIGMHLGNVDMVGQILAVRGLPITIPVESMRPEALFRRTQALRQSFGVQTILAESAGRALLRALQAGHIVCIMADRNLSRSSVEVEFMGRPAQVSKGPGWLISHTDVPVLLGFGIREPGGHFRGQVTVLPVQRTADKTADLVANAQIIMHALEEPLRSNPDQWCMFLPVWNGG